MSAIRWEDYEELCKAAVRKLRLAYGYDLDESELFSVGMEAFCKAVDKFDESYSVPFACFYRRALRNEFTHYIDRLHRSTMYVVDPEILKDVLSTPATQFLELECRDILAALTGDSLSLVRMVLVELRGQLATLSAWQMRGALRHAAAAKGWSRRRYDAAFAEVRSLVTSGI